MFEQTIFGHGAVMGIATVLVRATALAFAAFLTLGSAAAAPCVVSAAVTTNLGTYSPAAVKAGAVPALQTRAGITCPTAILALLSANYLRAKFSSQNNLVLQRLGGGGSIAYVASADAAGTTPFTQNSTTDYMQNNLLNLLGLLGGSSADIPFFVKPGTTATPPPTGSYSDRITIDWSWNMCDGIAVLGACLGQGDKGTGQSIIDVTLIVSPQSVILSMSTVTTWDPANQTNHPKAIPGSRQRVAIAVTNPDIVALDTGTLYLIVPTPPRASVSLAGDGTASADFSRLTEGSPASTVTLRYGGSTDATDDVDFSSDGGSSWLYQPVVGTEGAITHVRLRPQKPMAKQSAFSVSVPYRVK